MIFLRLFYIFHFFADLFCTFLTCFVLGSFAIFAATCQFLLFFLSFFFSLSYLPMNEVYLLWVTAICLEFVLLWLFVCFAAAAASCWSRNAFLLFGTQEVLWPGRQQTLQKFASHFWHWLWLWPSHWPTNCWRQLKWKSGYTQILARWELKSSQHNKDKDFSLVAFELKTKVQIELSQKIFLWKNTLTFWLALGISFSVEIR